MSNEAKTLTEQARALAPEDRIALVEDVLDSLDHADPALDQLWAREATARVAAYRRGVLAAKDLTDVLDTCIQVDSPVVSTEGRKARAERPSPNDKL